MSSKRARPIRKPVTRTPVWVGPAAIAAVLALLVGTFLVIRWYTTPITPPPPSPDTTQQVVTQITSLPASELDSIGQGTANNLIKRIKRIGFGFRNFDNYRIRALLYAGKPNWRVLGSIVVQ